MLTYPPPRFNSIIANILPYFLYLFVYRVFSVFFNYTYYDTLGNSKKDFLIHIHNFIIISVEINSNSSKSFNVSPYPDFLIIP